ncbi:MAG: hypothetical protein HC796_00045 [Synechococcaceae cyanobacterium RL_1_2]|jgi:hypothetical protein|nr:hypothetical protein [Synechococcaceae cyanobacterium RL_1_2]
MSEQISLIIRSADRTRQAAVQMPPELTIDQLLQAAQQRWNLPLDVSYAVRLERTGEQLDPNIALKSVELQENDVFEIYPILEAG